MAPLSGGPARTLPAKWRRYPAARLERYLQNGAVIRMVGFTHRLSVRKMEKIWKNNFSYNIYGFAINRIYKKNYNMYISVFRWGVKVVKKLFFECENKSRCE